MQHVMLILVDIVLLDPVSPSSVFVPSLVIDLVSFVSVTATLSLVHVSRISMCFMESTRRKTSTRPQYLATMPRRLWYKAKHEADQEWFDRRV